MSENNSQGSRPVHTDEEVNQLMRVVPVYWQGVPPAVVRYGLQFGLIRLGWTVRDYMLDAAKNMGYHTIAIWGQQGVGKSSRMLQEGFWIYGDWDAVLKNIVFRPSQFVSKLKRLPVGRRIPWVGFDDVGVHYPSTSWRTNIEQYEAIDSTWVAIRTKCSVVSLTIPLIDRLAKNLKDNVTIEEFIGMNQGILSERYIRLPGVKERVESNFRKVQIEPIHRFNLYAVPTDVFREYWNERLRLADEALDKLEATVGEAGSSSTDLRKVDGYISVLEIIRELKASPAVISQLCARSVIQKRRFNGRLYVPLEDYEYIKEYYQAKRQEKKKPEQTE